ncbi:MAG: hypothetical protein ACRCUY_14135 [Thermoguttaceae bacterium]
MLADCGDMERLWVSGTNPAGLRRGINAGAHTPARSAGGSINKTRERIHNSDTKQHVSALCFLAYFGIEVDIPMRF